MPCILGEMATRMMLGKMELGAATVRMSVRRDSVYLMQKNLFEALAMVKEKAVAGKNLLFVLVTVMEAFDCERSWWNCQSSATF